MESNNVITVTETKISSKFYLTPVTCDNVPLILTRYTIYFFKVTGALNPYSYVRNVQSIYPAINL